MEWIKLYCLWLVLQIDMVLTLQVAQYTIEKGYDKNVRPNQLTDVSIGLFINRISAVDENKEEISFDVFLKVIWEDKRIRMKQYNETYFASDESNLNFIELKIEERHKIWVPDLYIRQLREMKVLTLFEEISSLRLYKNSTIILSIGATIIIKCDMDFVLYPLDVQKCPVDFSSYKYSMRDMKFSWKQDNPIIYPMDFGDGFRLPKYVVSFQAKKDPLIVNYGDVDHCSARLEITLSREVKSYLLENYLPSTLFVSMSWGSFVVVPEVVPGRMVLLVTTLLSLVTMFDTVRNNSPDALELKCIEVWLISCTLFVFLALMEYFIVLFGIRYDKHWRTVKNKIHSLSSTNEPASTISSISVASNQNTQPGNPSRNGFDQATRIFGGLSRVKPETVNKPPVNMNQTVPEVLNQENSNSSIPSNRKSIRRFRNVADYALMYAGNQRGKLDQISLILFPVSFLLFTIVYWVLYLSESKKKSL